MSGEAENARAMLDKILAKEGKTYEELLNDLDKNKAKEYEFEHKTINEGRLIQQTMYMLHGKEEKNKRIGLYVSTKKAKKKIAVYFLTELEYIEALYLINIYLYAFRKEVKKLQNKHRRENKIILEAFVSANKIFSTERDVENTKTVNPSRDFFNVMGDIEEVHTKKAITKSKEEMEKIHA